MPRQKKPTDNIDDDRAPAIGSTCYLKSGSPRMTVLGLVGADQVHVGWCHYDTGQLHKEIFPIAALRRDWK